jgi:hypothetical protein
LKVLDKIEGRSDEMAHQEERENDASHEQPFARVEWDGNTTVNVVTVFEDFIRPVLRG